MIGVWPMPNHVICVKWGKKYTSSYANILFNMCKRHLTVPFEFHCITENPSELSNEIKVITLPSQTGIERWWSKMYMFSNTLPIQGTILYFDLDVMIFRNIDRLFTHQPGDFMIIRDFNRCRTNDWKYSNSSVMRFESGKLNYLWDEFSKGAVSIMRSNHGDQDYIHKRAMNDLKHWPDEWIRSYKWEMLPRKETSFVNRERKVVEHPPQLSENNMVAVFHGEPKPVNCKDPFVVDNWR